METYSWLLLIGLAPLFSPVAMVLGARGLSWVVEELFADRGRVASSISLERDDVRATRRS
jgi:hypothetical protein